VTAPILPLDLPFAKATLGNGLDVIVRRQGDLPIVAMNLWYHVGSKNEERRQRGFAHLFEHLMFEGSAHYPGDFFKPLQRLGAGVNGSTSSDRTNYYVDSATGHLELALAMESDRMGHLLGALTEAKLRIQKDVVKNEYRQNYANRPYGQVGRLLAEALYPPTHPYSWLTIGVMEDVEAASMDDVEAFFRRYYVPANASLALVGDIDPERGLELADRYFGGLPGGLPAPAVRAAEPPLKSDVIVNLRERVELERVYDVWPTVPHFHPDEAALAVLADVLGRGRSSRLYQRLVMREEVAQSVSVSQSSRELAGSFYIVVTLRPGRSRAEARALVREELEGLAARGVTAEELARVQNGRLAAAVYALDNVGGFGGVADRLNAFNIYTGDPGRLGSDPIRYQEVTAEAVSRAAQAYLVGRPRVALDVIAGPAPSGRAPLDRSVPPPPASAVPFAAPVPVALPLSGGSSVWVLPRRDLPIVAFTAVVRAGASAHGADAAGLAHLTASLLDEGTATRTAERIAHEAEGMGTYLSTSCGYDGSYVSSQCLSGHFPASLELAADVLLRPSFPEAEFRRVAGQTLASVRSERDSAEARAYRAFLRALYPAGHPYASPVDGDEATLSAFAPDALRAFHGRQYRPDRTTWVVAGDVDPEAVARRLDDLLAGWAPGAETIAEVPRVPRAGGTRLLLLDRPGAPQAVVRAGHVGLSRLDPDFFPMLLFNQVLGGQFSSRLNASLREQRGLTYGVRSHFDARRGAGPFAVTSSLQADRLGEALAVLRQEVVALLDERPPAEAELEDARRSLVEGQARHFETPSALVARYGSLALYGLGMDEHRRYAERLGAVTREGMQEAARRHLDPDALTVVVVADAAGARPALESLGWGAVVQPDEA
jgi:predicted Zn-dependent peptidase